MSRPSPNDWTFLDGDGLVEVVTTGALGPVLRRLLGLPVRRSMCSFRATDSTWHRSFDGRTRRSDVNFEDDHLVERVGPIRIELVPQFDDSGFCLRSSRLLFGSLSLGRRLLRLSARHVRSDSTNTTIVNIELLGGLATVTYGATLRPTTAVRS